MRAALTPEGLERSRHEFALIFYRWAQIDAERQAAQGFPLFSLLRDSLAAKYLRVYEGLPLGKRGKFLRAMVKRTHERAVEITGESISLEEEELIGQFRTPPWENDRKQLEAGWDRPRLTPGDRGRLRNLLAEHIAEETAGNFQMLTPNDFVLQRTFGPWKVSTMIEVKTKQNLGYEHSIAISEQPDAKLKEYTSITRWLGIGETNWNLMVPDELEQCVQAPIILAKYFLDAIPELLAKMSI